MNAETDAEQQYVNLTYIKHDQYLPEKITQVYYGSPQEDNWTYLGYVEEKSSYEKTTFTAFDADDKQVVSETSDYKQVNRHYQRAGFGVALMEYDLEMLHRSKHKMNQRTIAKQPQNQLSTHKKTNTMNTQTEKPKNEKPVSRLYIVEQGTWKNGQEVLTFYYKNDQGKPKAIAHTFVYYDKEGQTFRTQDAKGNEIFPPCANRYDLKKYALDNEQDLIQKFEKAQGQEKTPLQQNAQTTKQPEQAQQPVNNPEQPKRSVKQKNNNRKNELGEIRNEKDADEKEQSVSR